MIQDSILNLYSLLLGNSFPCVSIWQIYGLKKEKPKKRAIHKLQRKIVVKVDWKFNERVMIQDSILNLNSRNPSPCVLIWQIYGLRKEKPKKRAIHEIQRKIVVKTDWKLNERVMIQDSILNLYSRNPSPCVLIWQIYGLKKERPKPKSNSWNT